MTPNSILDVFAKSPLKPLITHMDTVNNCVTKLEKFLEYASENNWGKAKKERLNICKIEQEADNLKRKIRKRLPTGLFMPVDRADILGLLTTQDKIANKARDISGNVYGRKTEIPAEIQETFLQYYKKCIESVDQANKIVKKFNTLLETGFSEKEINIVSEMIYEIEKTEQETDEMQIEINEKLINIEKKIDPINMIFLYKIIESIGELADISKLVGEKLEIMLIRA